MGDDPMICRPRPERIHDVFGLLGLALEPSYELAAQLNVDEESHYSAAKAIWLPTALAA
jgi:hypothetical protein